jgi:serine/threonine protein kinase
MGEVYRAKDSKLKREVALKVLPVDVAKDRERLARFQREAEVLAALNHPHIAQIYGLDKLETSEPPTTRNAPYGARASGPSKIQSEMVGGVVLTPRSAGCSTTIALQAKRGSHAQRCGAFSLLGARPIFCRVPTHIRGVSELPRSPRRARA